jgi:hypothetical protein
MSAPGTRILNRVTDSETDGGEMIRTEPARELCPFGAKKVSPPTSRLYSLIVGTSWS